MISPLISQTKKFQPSFLADKDLAAATEVEAYSAVETSAGAATFQEAPSAGCQDGNLQRPPMPAGRPPNHFLQREIIKT